MTKTIITNTKSAKDSHLISADCRLTSPESLLRSADYHLRSPDCPLTSADWPLISSGRLLTPAETILSKKVWPLITGERLLTSSDKQLIPTDWQFISADYASISTEIHGERSEANSTKKYKRTTLCGVCNSAPFIKSTLKIQFNNN